jgi:hypothetical protein
MASKEQERDSARTGSDRAGIPGWPSRALDPERWEESERQAAAQERLAPLGLSLPGDGFLQPPEEARGELTPAEKRSIAREYRDIAEQSLAADEHS